MDAAQQQDEFPVVEFRRYPILRGEQRHFAVYFDTFFPEAFEQLGAITLGSFTERGHPGGFTELRGFHTLADRAIVSAEFYYGPVWREHRAAVNSMLADADDRIMLMTPLDAASGVPVLPSVDPRTEARGARGVVIAELFPVTNGHASAFARQADSVLSRYRAAGVRQAGMLVSLDVSNNFPQLPIAADGPFVIWLGVVRDDEALRAQFDPLVGGVTEVLSETGWLRGAPEVVTLDPTGRSRLRWRSSSN